MNTRLVLLYGLILVLVLLRVLLRGRQPSERLGGSSGGNLETAVTHQVEDEAHSVREVENNELALTRDLVDPPPEQRIHRRIKGLHDGRAGYAHGGDGPAHDLADEIFDEHLNERQFRHSLLLRQARRKLTPSRLHGLADAWRGDGALRVGGSPAPTAAVLLHDLREERCGIEVEIG